MYVALQRSTSIRSLTDPPSLHIPRAMLMWGCDGTTAVTQEVHGVASEAKSFFSIMY